jgi:hypothetical protein
MPGKNVAVITGDVITSTGIPENKRAELLACLKQATKEARQFANDFVPEIFQGDSFQGYTQNVSMALRVGLYTIMEMIKHGFGLRISVATGIISFDSGESLTSDGTAFRLSGRNLELLKSNDQVISVASDNENMNSEWQVHSATLNHLVKRCSSLQAEAIVEMIMGKTQTEAAGHLQIKQPAVQQRLQAAGWPLIQTILDRFESQF